MAEENAGDPMSSSNGGHLRLHSPTSGSRTETVTIDETQVAQTESGSERLVLRLKKPKSKKKVDFKSGTVDNENMNKKKSKCCCIYEKPQGFDQSSSSSSDDDDSDYECEHCHGHDQSRGSDPPAQGPPEPVA